MKAWGPEPDVTAYGRKPNVQDKTMKLIILEGPDGGGKTTLAAKLSRDLNALSFSNGPYPEMSRSTLFRTYVSMITPAITGHEPVVLDRCWISEPIYAEIIRGERPRLSFVDIDILESLSEIAEVEVILCLPSFETVKRGFADREQYPSSNHLARIYEAYETKVLTSLPIKYYDWTKNLSVLHLPLTRRLPSGGFLK